MEDCETDGRPLRRNCILDHAAHGNDEIAEPAMGARVNMGDEIKRRTEIQASNKMQLRAMQNDSDTKYQQRKTDWHSRKPPSHSAAGGARQLIEDGIRERVSWRRRLRGGSAGMDIAFSRRLSQRDELRARTVSASSPSISSLLPL